METPSQEQIQEWVAQAQQGEQQGIVQLFHHFSDKIYRFFFHRVSDPETAEDLTQTVFLEMLRSLHRYKKREDAKFSTWLFQIAHFRLIDHYRQRRPSVSLDEVPESAHPGLIVAPPEVTGMSIAEMLASLPSRHKTALQLRFVEDFSAADIAKQLNTSAGNVRVLQHRGIQLLRKYFPTDN